MCLAPRAESSMGNESSPADLVEGLQGFIYKGTTLPHIVVKRKCCLTPEGFTTYQSDKGIATGKLWQLHRRTVLEPQSPTQIRAHERHLRKAGPLRALSAYARDKNVLKLYCFRVEWPDKYAPAHGSSVELGFDSLVQAQEWHAAIAAHVLSLGGSSGGSMAAQYSLHGLSHSNSLSGGMYGGTGYASAEPSPFTSPVSSFPSTPNILSKQPSLAAVVADGSPQGGTGSSGDGGNGMQSAYRHSSSDNLSQQNRSTGGAAATAKNTARSGSGSMYSSGASIGNGQALQHQSSVGATDAGMLAAAMRVHAQNAASQQCSSNGTSTGVVVDECMVRWVPYKHANGMAIYYRQTPQEEGKGMPQASGEYMLSTAVQASPECCVGNLMLKADKSGSILSTAAFMEVLEDNGDMQVWHMVFHPAGSAGLATVLAAPRYTFMHQVLTSYEEGVYAVLFSSVPDEDVKPEWIARANARTQRAHRAVQRSDPGSGRRMPLWRAPVRCRITGAITLSALEGRSGRDSPQTLVTCIVRADFGGWLSSKSMLCSLGQALGLQEALMDRVLMRVMILKEDVEYSRFKTKPFQLLMVTPEDYDSSNQQPQQQQSQAQQQQQPPVLRHASEPAPPVQQQQQQQQQPHGDVWQTTSLQLPPLARRSTSSSVGGRGQTAAPAAAESGQPPTSENDLVSRTQSAAGAVAVAAAARVSAAASALAAHMTNPQQLWHEKRGSTSGYSAANTPPHSPQKHSGAGGPLVSFARGKTSSTQADVSLRSKTTSAAAEVIATAAPSKAAGVVAAAPAAATAPLDKAADMQQQQETDGSTGRAAESAASPGSERERFFSVTGAAGQEESTVAAAAGAAATGAAAAAGAAATGAAAAAGAAATGAAVAGGTPMQLLSQQDDESVDELFEEAAEGSVVSSSSLVDAVDAAGSGLVNDAGSAHGGTHSRMPYSEQQLQALIGGSLKRQYYEAIHDGVGTVRDVYSIRGPNYLKDRKKIPAGRGRYKLMAADLVATDHMMDHIGRFLPSVRCNGAAFSFVVDLIINYGSPVLHLVMVFSTDRHPNSLGPCPDDPLDAGEEWTPFDFTMSRFLHGTDEERNGMFKLIPHCAKGSWVVSQSVGTTPVILGRKLVTTYHQHDRYIEVDVDVASTQAVAYIVKMVQGATRSMLIDHAYLLESQFAHELPEQLIGAIRYKHLDMTDYTFVQVDQELPFSPVVPGIVGQ